MTVSCRLAPLALALSAACSGGGRTPASPPPPVNLPPTALAQSLSTPRDTPLVVTLSGSDPEGTPLTFAVATQPAHGALSGTAPALTYTPAAGYEGADSFSFTTSDGALTSSPTTVTITVTHVNHPPMALADTASTDFAWPVTIAALANDSDADGDPLQVTAVTQPAHGAASFAAASVTYRPAAGFVGDDTFIYTVSDGQGGMATGTVSVTVHAPATLRVAPTSLAFTATVEGAAPAPQQVTVTDTGGSPLRWTARSDASWLVLSPVSGQGSGPAGAFQATALPARTDGWSRPTAKLDAPSARYGHTAIWAGKQLIVWGGRWGVSGGFLGDGASYDPASDSWSGPISSDGAPSPRNGHAAAWTGRELIVWGGDGPAGYLGDGALYDPLFDRWRPMSSVGAPSPRETMAAAWTGTELVVWGGSAAGAPLADGARYDPATDTWRSMSSLGAPAARTKAASAFTGAELLVWGGQTGTDGLGAMVLTQTGGRYDPAADTWLGALPTDAAPSARAFAAAVWTGGELIVWGGQTGASYGTPDLAIDGHRYRPGVGWVGWISSDFGSVAGRRLAHAAAWTGAEMLVWGGYPAGTSGGRYTPPLWLSPGRHQATVTVADPYASNRSLDLAVTLDLAAPAARLAGAFTLASATSTSTTYLYPAALAAGAGGDLFAAGTVDCRVVSGAAVGCLTFGAGQASEVTFPASPTPRTDAWLSRSGADGALAFARKVTAQGTSPSSLWYARAGALATLADGSVTMAGIFAGQTIFGPGDPAETTLTPDGFGNGFLASFDVAGRLRWVRRVGGTSMTTPTSLAPLPGGGCLAAGRFTVGAAVFGPGEAHETTITNTSSGDHAFLARYGADGSLTWARNLADGPGGFVSDRVPLGATPDGAALVAFMLYGPATVGSWSPSPVVLGDSTVYRTILLRVEANGDLGWVNSGSLVGAEALASQADGSPVLTGGSAVAGFDPAGAPTWFQWMRGASPSGEALVTLADGSIFLSGRFDGWTSFWPGEIVSAGANDLFVGRMTSDGALAWVRGAGGPGEDLAEAAALLSDGTVAVLGSAVGSATFGTGDSGQVTLSPPVAGAPQLVVARYRP